MEEHTTIAVAGRLLVFGGTYGNLQATEALFAEAEDLGIGPEAMLCTGDLAAYCAQPRETVQLVRDKSVPVVMGNCEESLAGDAEDCGCGFEEGTVCDLLARQWYDFCRTRIDADAKRWMGGLPRRITVEIGGRRLVAIHGGVQAINRFVFPSSPETEMTEELRVAGAEGALAGHSGIPFVRCPGGGLWLNSGAVGLPANDGTPRVWYALIEACEGGLKASLKALAYDHATAARQMHAAGLANGYAACLDSGLWPSLDVLPAAERRRTGQPLAECEILWPATLETESQAAL
jgi:predicted phosphodiesterase